MNKKEAFLKKWISNGKMAPNVILYTDQGCVDEAEYFSEKMARTYWENIDVKREFEECYLALEFPHADERECLKFFDSPEVVCRNRVFQGVFVVFLPSDCFWVSKSTLKRLREYVEQSKSKIKFIFIIHNDVHLSKLDKQMFMGENVRFEEYYMERPSGEELCQYTKDIMKKNGFTMKQEEYTYLKKLLTDTVNGNPDTVLNYQSMKYCVDTVLCNNQFNQKRSIKAEELEIQIKDYAKISYPKQVKTIGFRRA